MDKRNIIEGMEWGKDVVQYLIMSHELGKETGKTTFLGINGPEGIGKKTLIRKSCNILGREFLDVDYINWIHNSDSFFEMYRDNVLIFISDTPIENGCYSNGSKSFVDKFKNEGKFNNIIFVFSSNAILGTNSAISTNFRVFLYGRLSVAEKISYARTIVIYCQTHWDLEKVYISDEVLKHIIKYYTKEAGVCSLSVLIHNLFEFIYWDNDYDKKNKLMIKNEEVLSILGNEKYVFDEMIAKKCLQGVGMAWTKWGGILLPIEMIMLKGSGQIFYSGNIGNIMKESVTVVVSYFKANYRKWNIKPHFFLKHDVHINIYEQGIYKDGSSAGLAFFVKMLCMIKNIRFKKSIAFSGEISLEGRVLRVGGLKEKLCIVQEQGIEKIVLPKQSWTEYQLLPNEIKDNLSVYFIDDVMDLKQIIQEEKR